MATSRYLEWLSGSLSADRDPHAPLAAGSGDDAVLGYAVGYDIPEIAPFVRSLRAGFAGRIILVVDGLPTLLAWLSAHGVEAVIAADRLTDWAPHPVVARFAAYARILQERPDIRNVVITDVRDVVFQGDPFAVPDQDLQFFIEAEQWRLADHAFNLKHLTAVVGEGLARQLGQRACICVGVVAGSSAAVARFCRALLLLCAIPRSSAGGAFGADQAACNLIAHLNLIGGEIRPNYGRVATIGLTPPEQLRIEDGLILNPDGSVSAIVHQYDRIASLAAHVQDQWGVPSGPGQRERSKTLRKRVETLGLSVLRRLPELR